MAKVERKEGRKGFTLMEIIVVFILLGILAVSIIPTFTQMDDVGYDTQQQGALGALRTAWTVAYADNSNSAPTLTQIAALVEGVDGTTNCACNGSTFEIECNGIYQRDGSTLAEFGSASATSCSSTIATPATIVIVDGGT